LNQCGTAKRIAKAIFAVNNYFFYFKESTIISQNFIILLYINITMKDYLISFLIGSSPFIFIPFYIAVANIPESKIDLKTYGIKVALYFGLMNVLATYIGKKYNISLGQRLVIVTILSIIIIWTIITINMPYNFKTKCRQKFQYVLVAIAHTIAYLIIIYSLEFYLNE
jgi:hypothetical protein